MSSNTVFALHSMVIQILAAAVGSDHSAKQTSICCVLGPNLKRDQDQSSEPEKIGTGTFHPDQKCPVPGPGLGTGPCPETFSANHTG